MNNLFQTSISATLARRLAEAADGFRNVHQVFFIAGYKFPHPIKDFPDLESAEIYFADKELPTDEYGIFGPFKTTDDVQDLELLGVENIEKVDLTIYYKNGHIQSETLPGGIDSIFFNLSSFEKFVFPYYCHLYGAGYAKKLRDNLISQYEKYAKSGDTKLMFTTASTIPHLGITYLYLIEETYELP
jgi:hypothetical protein